MSTQSMPVTQSERTAKVLIADDQVDVIEALRFLLKLNGYRVDSATSPSKVLQKLDGGSFDLLVMDLNYARDTTSGDEGLDLLDAIKRLRHRPSIIVMTAWGSIPLAVEAMRRGAADFVTKPWDNDRLIATVEEQLRLRALLAEARPDAVAEELNEAVRIQRSLLPRDLPAFTGFEVAMSWKPARSVGGDYPDVIPLDDDRFAICLADVVGKGMPAALLMSNVQAAVRSLAREKLRPCTLMERVNRVVTDNAVPGKFITAFYGEVSPTEKLFRYSNAGHNPPFLVRRSSEVLEMSEGGFVLGVFRDTTFAEGAIALEPGDRLVLYTDGLTECVNGKGEELGAERLQRIASRNRHLSAEAMQSETLDAVSAWCAGRYEDDVTVITLSVQG
jgi:sigma-B regulation protein RsbU (phosphoserine phosphatase)